jgi:hypothetical protein
VPSGLTPFAFAVGAALASRWSAGACCAAALPLPCWGVAGAVVVVGADEPEVVAVDVLGCTAVLDGAVFAVSCDGTAPLAAVLRPVVSLASSSVICSPAAATAVPRVCPFLLVAVVAAVFVAASAAAFFAAVVAVSVLPPVAVVPAPAVGAVLLWLTCPTSAAAVEELAATAAEVAAIVIGVVESLLEAVAAGLLVSVVFTTAAAIGVGVVVGAAAVTPAFCAAASVCAVASSEDLLDDLPVVFSSPVLPFPDFVVEEAAALFPAGLLLAGWLPAALVPVC